MQYGAELYPYQRITKTNKEEQSKKDIDAVKILKMLFYFTTAFLISRVLLMNHMAPFGIAFLLSLSVCKEERFSFVADCGVLIGYLSLYNNARNLAAYIFITGTISVLSYVMKEVKNKIKLAILFSIILFEFIAFSVLVYKLTIGVAFFTSAFEVACIFPLYFILEYSILCFKDIKTRHLFTNEEIICMAIMLSLVISGTWGLTIYEISIRNVLAFIFILGVSYINGSGVGAASGVAIGVIVGMSTNNMILFVGMYGVGGLITGIFKESGKWLSGLAYLIGFCILKIYSNTDTEFKIIEGIISCAVFYSIPNKIYETLSLEFDVEKKQKNFNSSYIEKIKTIMVGRLDNFSDVLYNMSEILNKLVDNDKLVMKGKCNALIENLADRVCSGCDMNSMCWKREMHYTYAAFGELIESYQEKKFTVPYEIERKCIKRTALAKSTEDIVNNYIISEMWRSRLSEGRELLVNQLNNMAESVDEIVEEFHSDVQFNLFLEKKIRRILEKKQFFFHDIVCYNDKKKRLVIKLSLNSCGGSQMCIKQILPLLNEVTERNLCVGDEGCSIDPVTNICIVTFEEMPKYHVVSYVNGQCKDGESYNGDSYTFGKMNDGTYVSILSDGMGSGPEAGKESRASIELLEKIINAGFSKATAIHTVNSVMAIKFSESEKFSTIDLNSIDLYSGEVEFMKVGAVASFIKSGEKVEVIKSKTLPIGVLDKVDIDLIQKKVKNGDLIIMLSDGVLDYNSNIIGKEEWVVEYLKQNHNESPQALADGLVKKAKELNGGKNKDDMTAIVSRVYALS